MGGRSPRAKATPAGLSKSFAMRAQSATGTCRGPIIWSRAVRPPTVPVAEGDEEAFAGDCRVTEEGGGGGYE